MTRPGIVLSEHPLGLGVCSYQKGLSLVRFIFKGESNKVSKKRQNASEKGDQRSYFCKCFIIPGEYTDANEFDGWQEVSVSEDTSMRHFFAIFASFLTRTIFLVHERQRKWLIHTHSYASWQPI